MKIYITGLPSGYEVEHLVRLFYPMAPLTLTPPENAEDCVWAEKTPDGLHALVRQDGRSAERHAPLPAPVEQGGETPEFSLATRARCPMIRGTFFGRFSLGRLRGANRAVLDGKPFRCVRSHEPDVPYRPGVCGMVFRCAESVVVNCGPPFLGLRHGAHRENHVFLMRRGLF